MTTSYRIVEKSDREKLEEAVQLLLRDGWEPIGGVATSGSDEHTYYAQAMVKRSI